MYSSVSFDKPVYPCNYHHNQDGDISFTLKSSLMLLYSHSSLLPYHHWSQVAFCHYNLVSYFLEFYVSGILQYSLSHVWLILLSMFFRFVYIIASVSDFFLLIVFHWLDIPPFTHSPLDVDLYCFWILASMSTKSWSLPPAPAAWLVVKTFTHWASLAPPCINGLFLRNRWAHTLLS